MATRDTSKDAAVERVATTPRRGRPGGRFDPVLLINGTLAGVAGVFATTTSVVVTVIAAGAAVILTVVVMWAGRR